MRIVTPSEPPVTKFVPTIDTAVPPAVVPESGEMVVKDNTDAALTFTHVTCVEMLDPNEFVAFSLIV